MAALPVIAPFAEGCLKFKSCFYFAPHPHPQQIAVPRNDEWTRFVRTLAEINENRDDAEELAAQRLAA